MNRKHNNELQLLNNVPSWHKKCSFFVANKKTFIVRFFCPCYKRKNISKYCHLSQFLFIRAKPECPHTRIELSRLFACKLRDRNWSPAGVRKELWRLLKASFRACCSARGWSPGGHTKMELSCYFFFYYWVTTLMVLKMRGEPNKEILSNSTSSSPVLASKQNAGSRWQKWRK